MYPFPTQEEGGEDGATDAVPGAGDGAGEHGEGLCGEEGAGEDGGKTGILHADFDGDGTLLGGIEPGEDTDSVAQQVAEGVVAEDDGEGPQEERETTGYEIIVNRRDDSAHDAGQADDAQSGHQGLNGREALALGEGIVEETADANGDNRHDEDVQEHADGIYLDDLAGQILHQQRRHHRSK